MYPNASLVLSVLPAGALAKSRAQRKIEDAAPPAFGAQKQFRGPEAHAKGQTEIIDLIELSAAQRVIKSATETVLPQWMWNRQAEILWGGVTRLHGTPPARMAGLTVNSKYIDAAKDVCVLARVSLYSRSPAPLALALADRTVARRPGFNTNENMSSLPRLVTVLFLGVLLIGCATGSVRDDGAAEVFEEETWDPFEGFNRAMFAFNEKFDAWLLKPVAKGYDWLLPSPVKSGVGNFFSNLFQPAVAVNDLLQGKPAQSARDAGRFVVNTTVGVLGFVDVAKSVGLEPKDEDWGQTFAVWGVKEGPYFVWPIIGPRYLRDTFGWALDWVSRPETYIADPYTSWGLVAVDFVDLRARLLPAEKVLEQAAGDDKYLFVHCLPVPVPPRRRHRSPSVQKVSRSIS